MYKIEVVQMERKMHEHNEFNHAHVLLYCKHCDIVYCESCKKEWKKEKQFYTWYNTSPQWQNCDPYKFPANTTAGDVSITVT